MSFPLINPSHQFFDTSGAPLTSGTVEFRDPTTNDLINTYPTADDADAQTNANDNPFTLDGRGGFTGIYLEDGVKYKMILKDSSGATVDTQDDIRCPVYSGSTIGQQIFALTTDETDAGVTPSDYSKEPGDVRRYGATLDGTTDDGGAVTRWINVGLQGTTLTIPDGTALCTTWTQIAVSSDIKIRGTGTIKGDGSVEMLRAAGGVIDIEGPTFDTWLSVVEAAAADPGTTPYIRIVGCKFVSLAGDTIGVRNAFNRVLIHGNRFENCSLLCIRLGDNTYADQDTWQRVIITDNECDTVTTSGAGNTAFCLVYGKHVTIIGNQIEDIQADTNDAWGIYVKARYSDIEGNNIHGLTSVSGVSQGITIKGSDRSETATPQGYNCNVIGNNLSGSNEGTGILINNEQVNCSHNMIENFIESIVGGGDDYVLVSNNIIYCPDQANGTYGINIGGPANYQTVTNNTIHQGQFGIRTVCSTSAAQGWKVDNNTIIDADDAAIYAVHVTTLSNASYCNNIVDTSPKFMQLENASGVAIKGNKWDNLTAGNVSIWLDLPSDNVSDLEISGNDPFKLQTTDATVTSAMLFNIPDDSACHVTAKAVAMESGGPDRAVYGVGGLFYRDGGGATQQGSTYDQFTAIESDATWGGLTLDSTSNQVRFRVAGVASQTINWSVNVEVGSVS